MAARGQQSTHFRMPTFASKLLPTPQVDSFRSRSGDRKREKGLKQQLQASLLPTPTASEYGSNKGGDSKEGEAPPSLRSANGLIGTAGLLILSEWMMGYPPLWIVAPALSVSMKRESQLARDWGEQRWPLSATPLFQWLQQASVEQSSE